MCSFILSFESSLYNILCFALLFNFFLMLLYYILFVFALLSFQCSLRVIVVFIIQIIQLLNTYRYGYEYDFVASFEGIM